MTIWPDGTNTGVPDGVTLTPSGSIIVTKAGTVIDGLDVKGSIYIQADNVTIKNSRVTSSDFAVIHISNSSTGTVVQNSEINGLNAGGQGIYGSGTFIGNDIYGVADGINVTGDKVLIQDNYIHDLGGTADSHYDGIQVDGGVTNLTIEHNTVINDHGQTAAVMIDDYFGPTNNVVVNNNLLVGGGYTIYVTGVDGNGTSNVQVTNNHMGSGQYGYTYIDQASPVYTGNINDGNTLAAQLDHQVATTPTPTPTPPLATPTAGNDILNGDAGNNTIDGKGGNDTINGQAGNDTLIGGAGKDTLTGGAGNDIFAIRSASESGPTAATRDVITDFTKGADKIDLTGVSASGLKLVAGDGAAYTGVAGQMTFATDSATGKTIVHGDLNGDRVDDFQIELTGIKQLATSDFVGVSAFTPPTTTTPTPTPTPTPTTPTTSFTGTVNADRLVGDSAANVLDGKAGNDTINGGAGNDTIIGGTGRDVMTGGTGNDAFVFKSVSEMGTRASTRDVITDFTHGQDKIDLSAIDANSKLSGDQDFTFLAADNAAFTHKAGELAWHTEAAQNRTVIQGDINGDGVHDFEIELSGRVGLTASDFLGLVKTATTAPTTGAPTTSAPSTGAPTTGSSLLGTTGADRLVGTSASDKIVGDLGRDVMTGGAGADSFIFKTPKDSGRDAWSRDVVTDFKPGTDKLDFSQIDANSKLAGNQAFTFLAADDAAFTHKPGELAWHTDTSTNQTIVQADLNGDGWHDFEVALSGTMHLTAGDFVL